MDVLDKTKGLKLIKMLRTVNLYPFFRKLEGSSGNNVIYKGEELVMMGSNNYLGLTHHPKVIEAGVAALKKWGAGCTGSRFLNGNLAIHEELEERIADFLGYKKAAVFASGFMANQGAIAALVGEGDYIFSDDENHACIIEGCRLSKGKIIVYRHNDLVHLEELLQSVPKKAGKLIITDGVFSMTGHIARYNWIHKLAKKYNARTYIDDAHGLGTVGVGGRGTGSHFNLKSDLVMGTFSKSLASQGGFICGDKDVVEWIQIKGKTFMFSAALSPSSVASAMAALDILEKEPDRVERSQANAAYLKRSFDGIGLDTLNSETCVIPIYIGDDKTALKLCNDLLKLGIFTTPVVYPAVPKGQALIRCSVMATHTKQDLDICINAFSEVAPTIFKAASKSDSEFALADLLVDGKGMGAQLLKSTGSNLLKSITERFH